MRSTSFSYEAHEVPFERPSHIKCPGVLHSTPTHDIDLFICSAHDLRLHFQIFLLSLFRLSSRRYVFQTFPVWISSLRSVLFHLMCMLYHLLPTMSIGFKINKIYIQLSNKLITVFLSFIKVLVQFLNVLFAHLTEHAVFLYDIPYFHYTVGVFGILPKGHYHIPVTV